MAKEAKNRVKQTLGSKGKSKKKRPHKIHVSKTANGKYMAEHEIEGQPNETHALNDIEELKQHLQENMGDEEAEPSAVQS